MGGDQRSAPSGPRRLPRHRPADHAVHPHPADPTTLRLRSAMLPISEWRCLTWRRSGSCPSGSGTTGSVCIAFARTDPLIPGPRFEFDIDPYGLVQDYPELFDPVVTVRPASSRGRPEGRRAARGWRGRAQLTQSGNRAGLPVSWRLTSDTTAWNGDRAACALERIGQLEFATAARLQGIDLSPRVGREDITTGDNEVARGVLDGRLSQRDLGPGMTPSADSSPAGSMTP